MSGPSRLADLPDLEALAREALTLAATLDVARAVQWERSPRLGPTSVGAPTRPTGEIPDPVFGIVSDPRRLGVRDAVVAGESALARTFGAVVAVRLQLEEQLREARRTD